ncbi:tripartite tricarboxylate transporter TctB family protein [Bosea caraganae]|nr:tripartite tricarboxylate transporter TctB family protein [Bosea caraganae]
MQIRDHKDFALGSACLAIGAVFALTATSYNLGTASKMGPGYFPFVLGTLLAIAGAVIAVRSAAGGKALRRLERVDLKAGLLVLGSICLFAVLFDDIGLVLAIVGAVLLSSRAAPDYSLKQALAAGLVLCVLCVVIFAWALGLQMPIWPSF